MGRCFAALLVRIIFRVVGSVVVIDGFPVGYSCAILRRLVDIPIGRLVIIHGELA